MSNEREKFRQMAEETMRILNEGSYTLYNGKTIDIKKQELFSRDHTEFYEPKTLLGMMDSNKLLSEKTQQKETIISARNHSTLDACHDFGTWDLNAVTTALNFASAKNPGGGFMNGAVAQEESLARSSALPLSLFSNKASEFYEYHNEHEDRMYSDRMIWTPKCTVFRDNYGKLLEKPYTVNFITCAAPNIKGLDVDKKKIEKILKERADKILFLAKHHNTQNLILGAWGCGVFSNDPVMVSDIFDKLLRGKYKNAFEMVHFAVLDNSKEWNIFNAFNRFNDNIKL